MRKRTLALLAAVCLLGACGTSKAATPTTTAQKPTAPHGAAVVSHGNVPASINDTCAVDVTVPLARWMYGLRADAVAHSVVANLGTGCYLVNGSLFLRGFRDFVLEGGTFEEKAPTRGETYEAIPNGPAYCGSSHWTDASGTNFLGYSTNTEVAPLFFEGGCDITVRDVRFIGPNVTGEGGGIAQTDTFLTFAGTQDVLVDGISVRGPFGDCVDAQALHEAPGPVEGSYEALNVTIEHSACVDAGRVGVGVILASKVNITHDSWYGANLTVFDIEWDSTGGTQADIDITDNGIYGQHYGFLLAALTGAKLERLQFSSNAMFDGAQMRVWIRDGQLGNNVRLDLNRASGVDSASGGTDPAIRITGITGTTVAVDHNAIPVGHAGLAQVPRGAIVCQADCPVIHVVGPAIAQLP